MNYCPICAQEVEFMPFGLHPREKAFCPICGSLERHRFAWVYLNEHTTLARLKPVNGPKMLHVGPVMCLMDKFKKMYGTGYIAVDIVGIYKSLEMDITAIAFVDNTFNFIMCSHVLEHIQNDRKALGELYRVLKPGGSAMIFVPVIAKMTTCDSEAVVPIEDRQKAYGNPRHVRVCGFDYVDRIKEAGFKVRSLEADALFSIDKVRRLGLAHCNRGFYYCVKEGKKQ